MVDNFWVENKELHRFLSDISENGEASWGRRFNLSKLFIKIMDIVNKNFEDCDKIVFDKRGQISSKAIVGVYQNIGFKTDIPYEVEYYDSLNHQIAEKIKEIIPNPNIKSIYLVIGNPGYNEMLNDAVDLGKNVTVFTTKKNRNNFSGRFKVVTIDDLAKECIFEKKDSGNGRLTQHDESIKKHDKVDVKTNELSLSITFMFSDKNRDFVREFINSVKHALSKFPEFIGTHFVEH